MARSNRTLTQFVVDQLRTVLVYGIDQFKDAKAGNTEIVVDLCECCPRPPHLVVKLFDKEIIRLFFSPLNPRVIAGFAISTGDFYDSKGRPSRTTRERLNGILDSLGTSGFIPEGVRVFIRSEDGQCCLGKGDACKAFDSGSPMALILSHPRDLVFS